MRYIDISIPYMYAEEYIPPRCRKPRVRDKIRTVTIHIPCVTPDEAPIAFRHPVYNKPDREYRFLSDTLFVRVRWDEKCCGKTGWFPFEELKARMSEENTRGRMRSYCYPIGDITSVSKCRRLLQKKYGGYLVVENNGELEIWERVGEPRYEVCTFGLGHNHGGTGLFIENHYNPNVNKANYFTALQAEGAVRKALEVASARGDTGSLEHIRNTSRIEVLIPEAVKLDPNKEAGEGNPLLNDFESLIQASGSSAEAGLLVFTAAALKRK